MQVVVSSRTPRASKDIFDNGGGVNLVMAVESG